MKNKDGKSYKGIERIENEGWFVAKRAEDGRVWERASDDKGFDGKTNISKQKENPTYLR